MFFQMDMSLETFSAHRAVKRPGDVQLLMVSKHGFRLECLATFRAFVPVLAVRLKMGNQGFLLIESSIAFCAAVRTNARVSQAVRPQYGSGGEKPRTLRALEAKRKSLAKTFIYICPMSSGSMLIQTVTDPKGPCAHRALKWFVSGVRQTMLVQGRSGFEHPGALPAFESSLPCVNLLVLY